MLKTDLTSAAALTAARTASISPTTKGSRRKRATLRNTAIAAVVLGSVSLFSPARAAETASTNDSGANWASVFPNPGTIVWTTIITVGTQAVLCIFTGICAIPVGF